MYSQGILNGVEDVVRPDNAVLGLTETYDSESLEMKKQVKAAMQASPSLSVSLALLRLSPPHHSPSSALPGASSSFPPRKVETREGSSTDAFLTSATSLSVFSSYFLGPFRHVGGLVVIPTYVRHM